MNRRRLLATAAAAAVPVSVAGCTGSSCEDRTIHQEWLSEANNFEVMEYMIERDEVTVTAGPAEGADGYGFDPPAVVIRAGTVVRWVNTSDEERHRVVDECGRFESDDVPPGGTYERTFTTPGIYTYECDYHGDRGMRGAFRVE